MDMIELLYRNIHNLPGERAHVEMYPDRAKSSEALKTANNVRLSAVMGLTFTQDQNVKIILIQRPLYEGNHSGQIGFPGGKYEDSDFDLLNTAYRETEEEIGINADQIQLIGRLSDVYIPVSNFLVQPYIGYLNSRPNYRIDEREVSRILEINLADLLKTESIIKTNIPINNGLLLKNMPAFQIDGNIIWGATALMLNEIKLILLQK